LDFIDKKLEDYCRKYSQTESDFLNSIARETHLQFLKPRMLSGHLQGRLLSLISKFLKPNNILEIGSFTGYSAFCLAEGLQSNGKLYSIDNNPELLPYLNDKLLKSDKTNQIEFIIGDARQIIPGLNVTFDLVFIDADKESYSEYYEMTLDKINSGGVIIADNVLWSGKVLQRENEMDSDTNAIHSFNNMVSNDKRVEQLLLPFRDGLQIIRKK
jgi:predicted O-methyltransferase YrrM